MIMALRGPKYRHLIIGMAVFVLPAVAFAQSAAPPIHDLLSAVHQDTQPGQATSGDLIVGGANGRWLRLSRCRMSYFVASNGTDTACSNDGSELIKLNPGNLFGGTVPDAVLPNTLSRYNAQNPVFNPGRLETGTDTTWTFRTSTDNAVATVLVSSEGTDEGATPSGYAQLMLNAQDEVHNPDGSSVGANMSGYLRVAGKTFNNFKCLDSLCPETTELLSNRHLRLTTSGGGTLSFVQRGQPLVTLDTDGFLKSMAPLFGIGPKGEQAYQLGPLGMEIGGEGGQLFFPPRLPPADAMSSRRWVDGSLRVAQRVSVGCDLDSPFARATEPGEVKDQAGLCVQARGTTNIGAFITSPAHAMSSEATALRIDTRGTTNLAANVGIAIVSGNLASDRAIVNGGTGGGTSIRAVPLSTAGIDQGIVVEAEEGVEFPLAVRAGAANRLLVCGDGGVVIGRDCTTSRGAGTMNLARDIYRDGTAFTNPDYVFERFYTGHVQRFAGNAGASTYPGLLPLAELEKVTQTTLELPRIGQAQGVLERQDAVLASLEEAYLYIFELNRQLQELKSRLAASEKQP